MREVRAEGGDMTAVMVSERCRGLSVWSRKVSSNSQLRLSRPFGSIESRGFVAEIAPLIR